MENNYKKNFSKPLDRIPNGCYNKDVKRKEKQKTLQKKSFKNLLTDHSKGDTIKSQLRETTSNEKIKKV
jgi:hypothetical protein